MEPLPENVLPHCNRCGRRVETGTYAAVLNSSDEIVKYQVQYNCHGESSVNEVTPKWMNESGLYEKLVDTAFESPAPVPMKTEGQVIRDDQNRKLRLRRQQQHDYITKTLIDFASGQPDYEGVKGSLNNVQDWCSKHQLRLETRSREILSRTSDPNLPVIVNVVVDHNRVVGRLELPFWPDAGEPKWIPVK